MTLVIQMMIKIACSMWNFFLRHLDNFATGFANKGSDHQEFVLVDCLLLIEEPFASSWALWSPTTSYSFNGR